MNEKSLRSLMVYLDGILRPGFWGNISLVCTDGEVSTVRIDTSAKMNEIEEMIEVMNLEDGEDEPEEQEEIEE